MKYLRNHRFSLILIFVLTVVGIYWAGITVNDAGNKYMPAKIKIEGTILKNVTYKSVSENENLKLDLYLPNAPLKKTPVVLFIHGGGWTSGDKEAVENYYRQYILAGLLKKKYAVISINYRTVNASVHFPAPVEDCRDAVRWVRKNASLYNLDPDNIGLWGASAGGHLALMAAYSPERSSTYSPLKQYSNKVRYVIDNFGPSDLNELLHTDASPFLLRLFKIYSPEKYATRKQKLQYITGLKTGASQKEIKFLCGVYSPLNYINGNTVPTLILHGDSDKTVPLSQSENLAKALKENGVKYQFFTFHTLSHGFKNARKNDIQDICSKTIDFIADQH